MNILFITYQGDIAGSTNSISYLAKGLAERGHNIYVGCRKESLLYSMLEETKVHLVPMTFKGRFDLKNIRQIRDCVVNNKIQIINAQSSWDRYTTVFARWMYGLNVKIFHTRRQTPKSVGGFFQNLIYVKGTDGIIVISDELKKTFIKKGFPKNHLHVIYNGIPAERFLLASHVKAVDLRKKYKLQNEDKVIGCISRMKNQHQLVEALQYLDPAIKVLFAGIPNGSLDTWVEKYKIKNKIIYAGFVDGEEIMSYYLLCNLSVLASTMDGFGLVLVEAMGLGIPVIGTSAEGIKNVIEDGKNGFLFEDGDAKGLADKIHRVLNNYKIRNELIENGKKTAYNKFSVNETINNYEKLFRGFI